MVFFIIYKNYNEEKTKNIQVKKYETICGKYIKSEIKINKKIISVDTADNDCKRNLGLSGKKSFNEEGMFFIFEKMGNYGFWMKDMNFSIDILWINDNFEIVGMEKNISLNTYPKIFGKNYLAKYVLEIFAGYSDKNNIKVGDKIIYKN